MSGGAVTMLLVGGLGLWGGLAVAVANFWRRSRRDAAGPAGDGGGVLDSAGGGEDDRR